MLVFRKAITHVIKSFEATVTPIQRPEVEVRIRKKVKPRFGNYTKPFVSLWKEFVGISYVFVLFVIGEEVPIGFSWLLY